MQEFKYVMFKGEYENKVYYVPLIFPTCFVHADMAKIAPRTMHRSFRIPLEIASAGFINLSNLEVWGESESLDIKSDPKDSERIANHVNVPYIG